MSDALNTVYNSIDQQHAHLPAATRRKFVAGAAATLGSMGLLGWTDRAMGADAGAAAAGDNSPENILNIAATAEVLATIVNTVGFERVGLDPVTKRNVESAAREELIHYQVLTSLGGKPLATTIHVPDEVFANEAGLLDTLIVGDQIFINAYLLATTVFARPGTANNSKLARMAAEFMGAEAVHRALARQSLGLLGNDRAFVKFLQRETAPGNPDQGLLTGFGNITKAVTQLEGAGFGFGKAGSKPGTMYDFAAVSARTPDPADVNTRMPN